MLRAKNYPVIFMLLRAVLLPDATEATSDGSRQVPVFNDGVLIRVPVTGLGRDLYFMVDTGFTISAIDAKYKQQLGDQLTTYFADSPLGSHKALEVFHCPDLSVAGKRLGLAQITSLDLQMPRYISGKPCDGVLGMDFFSKNVVAIDFDRQTLTLYDAVPESVEKTFVAVPLVQSATYYSLAAYLNQDRPVQLMVDTGETSSIALNAAAWEEVFGDRHKSEITATFSDAANQVAQSKIGVIDQLSIGGLNYTNFHATLIRNPDNPSHVGLGYFKRHSVVFDFANRRLYIRPGAKYGRPDQEDMSGLHLLREDGLTIVYSVDKNSPAFAQGIQANDVVESINGQRAALLSMHAIRRALMSTEGAQIDMQVRHGDQLRVVSFALRKTL